MQGAAPYAGTATREGVIDDKSETDSPEHFVHREGFAAPEMAARSKDVRLIFTKPQRLGYVQLPDQGSGDILHPQFPMGSAGAL